MAGLGWMAWPGWYGLDGLDGLVWPPAASDSRPPGVFVCRGWGLY